MKFLGFARPPGKNEFSFRTFERSFSMAKMKGQLVTKAFSTLTHDCKCTRLKTVIGRVNESKGSLGNVLPYPLVPSEFVAQH